jgi:ribulose-5-phosphate 4-epimerase/fuculose-1-phosphate aldolase
VSLRAEVLATAREMHRLGLVVGTAGNVSAREGDVVYITPRALPYGELSEGDVVKLSSDGVLLAGGREPSSERRLHLAIYAERPEITAIVHTHSVHATAWSFLDETLDTGTEELMQVAGGPVRTAAVAEPGTDAIARAAVDALKGRSAALLARHGVLGVGDSPARALDVCAMIEHQAELAWLLRRA